MNTTGALWTPPNSNAYYWPIRSTFDLFPYQFNLSHVQVQVSWRPPQQYLHYRELYVGIYEYLRAPPSVHHRTAALLYLEAIRENNIYPFSMNSHYIQNHRILWIQEWLKAMPDDSTECSDAETEMAYNEEYEEVD